MKKIYGALLGRPFAHLIYYLRPKSSSKASDQHLLSKHFIATNRWVKQGVLLCGSTQTKSPEPFEFKFDLTH